MTRKILILLAGILFCGMTATAQTAAEQFISPDDTYLFVKRVQKDCLKIALFGYLLVYSSEKVGQRLSKRGRFGERAFYCGLLKN
jgi:hypothetical protein